MDVLRSLPLTGTGPRAVILAVLAACVVALCARPPRARRDDGDPVRVPARHWWGRAAGPVLGAAAILAVGAWLALEVVWRPLPDRIDAMIYAGAGFLVAGAGLFAARRRMGLRRSVAWTAPVLAVLLVAVAAAANSAYHLYPTVDSLSPADAPREISPADVPDAEVDERPGPVADWWEPPAGMPRQGAVVTFHVDPVESGFAARDGEAYLPPAYFTEPRPRLPVVVLLHGVPGAPEQWFDTDMVGSALDRWARRHGGLAPIVVAVDPNGSTWHDTLCVDSPEGNARTYLTRDVPAAIRATFDVDPDPRAWAVGGLSRGGTCSLQTALAAPDVYRTFLDMSGELHPLSGDRATTIGRYFHGDAAAYDADDPAVRLTRERPEGLAGLFIAGDEDVSAVGDLTELDRLARAAGVDSSCRELPGGHTWEVWGPGFAGSLDWLGERLGLAAPG